MDVVVYTTPTCPYCRQAKDFLTQNGVKFVERDVAVDPAAAAAVADALGRGALVPALVSAADP